MGFGLKLLGSLPMDPTVARCGDQGKQMISGAAKPIFEKIVEQVRKTLDLRSRERSFGGQEFAPGVRASGRPWTRSRDPAVSGRLEGWTVATPQGFDASPQ